MRVSRGVSPVISVILMVAIVVILVTTASVFIFDSSGGLNEPAPFVADTTGEFVIDNSQAGDNQIVQVTHRGGDGVAVDEIEIIVRASGPSLDTDARLVDLPADDTTIDNKNIEGNVDLIDTSDAVQIIQEDDSNVWSAGDTITLLPERVERVLLERRETITFCMIWRSVSATAAVQVETSPIHRFGQTISPGLRRSLPTAVAHRPVDRPWADLGQPAAGACDAGTPTPFALIFHCRRNSSSSS